MKPLKDVGQIEDGYYWLLSGAPKEQLAWQNLLPRSEWEVVYICESQIIRVIATGVEPIDVHLLAYPDAVIGERLTPPSIDERAEIGGGEIS